MKKTLSNEEFLIEIQKGNKPPSTNKWQNEIAINRGYEQPKLESLAPKRAETKNTRENEQKEQKNQEKIEQELAQTMKKSLVNEQTRKDNALTDERNRDIHKIDIQQRKMELDQRAENAKLELQRKQRQNEFEATKQQMELEQLEIRLEQDKLRLAEDKARVEEKNQKHKNLDKVVQSKSDSNTIKHTNPTGISKNGIEINSDDSASNVGKTLKSNSQNFTHQVNPSLTQRNLDKLPSNNSKLPSKGSNTESSILSLEVSKVLTKEETHKQLKKLLNDAQSALSSKSHTKVQVKEILECNKNRNDLDKSTQAYTKLCNAIQKLESDNDNISMISSTVSVDFKSSLTKNNQDKSKKLLDNTFSHITEISDDTEFQNRLKSEDAKNKQPIYTKVNPDGNCFFRAVAVSLGYNDDDYHLQLREKAIGQLIAHPELYESSIVDGDINGYIQNYIQSGAWNNDNNDNGIDVLVNALSDVLEINFRIETLTGINNVIGNQYHNYILLHLEDNHYTAVTYYPRESQIRQEVECRESILSTNERLKKIDISDNKSENGSIKSKSKQSNDHPSILSYKSDSSKKLELIQKLLLEKFGPKGFELIQEVNEELSHTSSIPSQYQFDNIHVSMGGEAQEYEAINH